MTSTRRRSPAGSNRETPTPTSGCKTSWGPRASSAASAFFRRCAALDDLACVKGPDDAKACAGRTFAWLSRARCACAGYGTRRQTSMSESVSPSDVTQGRELARLWRRSLPPRRRTTPRVTTGDHLGGAGASGDGLLWAGSRPGPRQPPRRPCAAPIGGPPRACRRCSEPTGAPRCRGPRAQVRTPIEMPSDRDS